MPQGNIFHFMRLQLFWNSYKCFKFKFEKESISKYIFLFLLPHMLHYFWIIPSISFNVLCLWYKYSLESKQGNMYLHFVLPFNVNAFSCTFKPSVVLHWWWCLPFYCNNLVPVLFQCNKEPPLNVFKKWTKSILL